VYQNTGIAMTSCLTLFSGEEQNIAVGVPFWYTGMQTLFVGVFCLVTWKLGWSKAPANENIFKVLLNSYEIAMDENEEKGEGDMEASRDAGESTVQQAQDDVDTLTEPRIKQIAHIGL
jgi:hypothetical protein